MDQFNRREWLKSSGLISTAFLSGLGFSGTVLAEERKFNPRSLELPVRLSSNENPYGPSEVVRNVMRDSFDIACRYPNSYGHELVKLIAEKEGVSEEHIVVTGGSTEGLKVAGLAYGIDSGEIIAPRPTFLAMMNYAEIFGAETNWVDVDENMDLNLDEMERRISSRTRLIFLCNPNNPTSTLVPAQKLRDFCESVSSRVTVFSDEAYYDFIDEPGYPSMVELVKRGSNVIVSRTFSKVYGLAGLRIGYLVARPDIAALLNRRVVAYTNVLALMAATAALKDKEFYNFSLKKNKEARDIICQTLDELGLSYARSQTNFVFFRSGVPIQQLIPKMMEQGVMIGRPFPPFEDWCRVSTGTIDEVKLFSRGLKKVLG